MYLLASRHSDACPPAWRPPPGRRFDRLDVEAAAGDQPRDERVGVPHVAGSQLVAAPHGRRYVRHQFEEPSRAVGIVAEPARALDGLGDVRDDPVPPAAHLIAEEPQASRDGRANRTLGDHTTSGGVVDWNRGHLDHEPALRHASLQRRVVEVAHTTTAECRRHGFEQAPVQPHRPTAGPERQPVKVYGGAIRAHVSRSLSRREITRMITDPRATWIVRTAERAAENPHRPALPGLRTTILSSFSATPVSLRRWAGSSE